MIRKFDIVPADPVYVEHLFHFDFLVIMQMLTIHRPDSLPFRDTFLPFFYGKHLNVNMKPVDK